MLWLQDVPGFTFILIHTGNTDQHTSGCYIVGETQQDLDKGKDGFVGNSGNAYKKMYPKVVDAILQGEDVEMTYTNIEDLLELPLKLSELRGQVKIMEAEKQGRYINPDPNPEKGYFYRSDHISFAKKVVKNINSKKEILDKQIDDEIKKAEVEIDTLKQSAPEKINKIAVVTSAEILKKLIGAEVNNSSISAIVDDLVKKNGDKYYGH